MTTMKRALRLCEARAKLREWQDMDIVRVGEDERRIMEFAVLMMEEFYVAV